MPTLTVDCLKQIGKCEITHLTEPHVLLSSVLQWYHVIQYGVLLCHEAVSVKTVEPNAPQRFFTVEWLNKILLALHILQRGFLWARKRELAEQPSSHFYFGTWWWDNTSLIPALALQFKLIFQSWKPIAVVGESAVIDTQGLWQGWSLSCCKNFTGNKSHCH